MPGRRGGGGGEGGATVIGATAVMLIPGGEATVDTLVPGGGATVDTLVPGGGIPARQLFLCTKIALWTQHSHAYTQTPEHTSMLPVSIQIQTSQRYEASNIAWGSYLSLIHI